MRKYYIYNTPFLQLPEESSSGFNLLSKELKKQLTSFRKNFTNNNHFVEKRFLQQPIILSKNIFFYEENGTCYEFFSNVEVGQIINSAVLDGNLPEKVYFGNDDIHYNYGHELTVEEFTEYVASQKDISNKLSTVMQSYFSLCRNLAEYKAKLDSDKKAAEIEKNTKNIDWLEKHIDKR